MLGLAAGVSFPVLIVLFSLESLVPASFDASAPMKALSGGDMKELLRQEPGESSWAEIEEAWEGLNLEDSKPVERPYFPGMSLP